MGVTHWLVIDLIETQHFHIHMNQVNGSMRNRSEFKLKYFLKLFRKHYKEYLIFKLNEALIDPADEMDVGELKAVIMREEKPVPEGDENDAQYKERLKEVSRECCTGLNVCQ